MATYTLISSQTLSSSASSVTFSSIPQTYTDLVLKVSVRSVSDTGRGEVTVIANSDSSTDYSETYLGGNGSSTLVGNHANVTYLKFVTATTSSNAANTFGNTEIYIPNYTSSTTKPVSIYGVQEDNSASTSVFIFLVASQIRISASITSLTLSYSSNMAAYSTFYLYGINNS